MPGIFSSAETGFYAQPRVATPPSGMRTTRRRTDDRLFISPTHLTTRIWHQSMLTDAARWKTAPSLQWSLASFSSLYVYPSLSRSGWPS